MKWYEKPLALIGAISIAWNEMRHDMRVGVCEACGAIADIRDHTYCPDCGAFLDEAEPHWPDIRDDDQAQAGGGR